MVSLGRVYFFQRRRRRINFCLPTVTCKTFVFICRAKMITFTLIHTFTPCGNLAPGVRHTGVPTFPGCFAKTQLLMLLLAALGSSTFLVAPPICQPPAVTCSVAAPTPRFAATLEPRMMAAASAEAASLPSDRVVQLVKDGASRSDAAFVAEVKSLLSTTSASPSAPVDWTAVAGTWKVVHAPHIDTLSKLALASFDIQCMGCLRDGTHLASVARILRSRNLSLRFARSTDRITPEGGIGSYVRYYSPLVGAGWLCTDGTISNEPAGAAASSDPSVRIIWDRIWWVPSDDYRSGPPTDPNAEGVALRELVQAAGKAGFIESLSVFPVRYIDSQVAAFNFQAFTVTCIRQ